MPIIEHATHSGGFSERNLPDLGSETRLVVDESPSRTALRVASTSDIVAPTVMLLGPTPNPHVGAIDTLSISFSEPVTGFDISDLTLTLGGGVNLLAESAAPSSSDGMNWTLSGLSSLTSIAGSYTLALNASGSGINDLAGNPLAAGASVPFIIAGSVVGRRLFYNQSRFDGNDAAANAADDAAIATDKIALLPGGTSSFANYTSYNRGINGLMIDIAGLPPALLTAGDFSFQVGNSSTSASGVRWPRADRFRATGAGVGGSSRVTLVWPTGPRSSNGCKSR